MTKADKLLEKIRAITRAAAPSNNPCCEIVLGQSQTCSGEPPEDEETAEQAFDRAMRGI